MEPILESAVEVRSHVGPDDERTLADDVLDGLTRPLKELAPKHLYDARGTPLPPLVPLIARPSLSCRRRARRRGAWAAAPSAGG